MADPRTPSVGYLCLCCWATPGRAHLTLRPLAAKTAPAAIPLRGASEEDCDRVSHF